MTDLPFTTPLPDATRPERKPAKCRRHDWVLLDLDHESVWGCARCHTVRDDVRARRGRTARKRGITDELEVARILGGVKVGMYGHPWDVEVPGYLRAQSKKLAHWPSLNEIVAWLDAIPAGPELRAVTLADAPGNGRKVRRLIVIDLHEYARWHGREPE